MHEINYVSFYQRLIFVSVRSWFCSIFVAAAAVVNLFSRNKINHRLWKQICGIHWINNCFTCTRYCVRVCLSPNFVQFKGNRLPHHASIQVFVVDPRFTIVSIHSYVHTCILLYASYVRATIDSVYMKHK